MLNVDVPGRGKLCLSNLLIDFNGTIAVDGKLISGVEERINELSKFINIYVLTADTFGTAKMVCENLNVSFLKLKNNIGAEEKLKFLNELGSDHSVAIGNGFNDRLMLEDACLGIAVVENEGASVKALISSDIFVKSINDAFDLLLNTKRITATLRY